MPPAVHAILLGRAQDAGVPQAGCACPRCAAAWTDPTRRERPACLGLVDGATGQAWLIDATPAFPSQLRDLLAADVEVDIELGIALDIASVPARRLAGILLTHAHIGHYAGLIHLGREAMGARGVPVHASASMAAFIRANAPWRQLVELGNIDVRAFDGAAAASRITAVALSDRLTVTPVAVPHRAEWSDAHAFVVAGPSRRLLWCPDIDRWDDLDGGLPQLLLDHRIDIACLDATFLGAAELGGRGMRDVPHPLAGDTAAAVGAARAVGWAGEAWLIHFNHTNALLDDPAAAAVWAAERGVGIGREGQRWTL